MATAESNTRESISRLTECTSRALALVRVLLEEAPIKTKGNWHPFNPKIERQIDPREKSIADALEELELLLPEAWRLWGQIEEDDKPVGQIVRVRYRMDDHSQDEEWDTIQRDLKGSTHIEFVLTYAAAICEQFKTYVFARPFKPAPFKPTEKRGWYELYKRVLPRLARIDDWAGLQDGIVVEGRAMLRQSVPSNGQSSERVQPVVPPLERALGILVAHSDWTDTQIAAEVGVRRQTLYKPGWKKFQDARKAMKQTAKMPRGSKDRDGQIEAVADDDDG